MIDLHVHLLPGVDDGPATLGSALALARSLVAGGVGTAVATPHLRHAPPSARPDELAGRVRSLCEALAADGVELAVRPGAEVELLWALRASTAELQLASLGGTGRWLLVETPYGELPERFEEHLFGLVARGFAIVLAHPERSPTLQRRPDRLVAMVERGSRLQVTGGALLGRRGSASGRLARALVRDGLAHVLASDAHGADGPHRASLSEAHEAAERLRTGAGDALTVDGPEALLAGEDPPSLPPAGRRRRFRRS